MSNIIIKNDVKKLFFILCTVFLVNSCVNIKKEYPQITYYSLQQARLLIDSMHKRDASLLIRSVDIPESYSARFLIAEVDNRRVQRYFYHRWINDLSSLATDFLEFRIISYNLFGKGVVRSSSITIPDFYLESKIIALDVHNSTISPDSNYVSITMNFNFFQRTNTTDGTKLLFSNTYSNNIRRPNNFAGSIPPAISRNLSVLIDYAVADMARQIEQLQVK